MTIYNILLFGESGAGKSTTINALVNYLRYASFEDAMSGKFMQIIPSKITLLHPITYENMVIQHGGDDPNELHNEDGASITQSPKDYLFTFDEKQYRIIDTPGMGDTRGLETDKKNFQSIMEHLKSDPELQKLHAICFLIKTNTTRKTAFFAYCLNQLLSVLHRDACANLIFCFTFSRNSLYGPGDGYQTLKSFLQSNELVRSSTFDLKTEVNCFYIDNEAFRFLLAKKYNYPFKKNREKDYKESWDNSVAHAFKMLSLIPTLKPHDLKDTFTLMKGREWITWLTEPLELIKNKIAELSNEVEDEKENLQKFHENKHFVEIGKLNKMNESKILLIKEFQSEFHQVENFIFKLAEFVSLSSNVRCEKLLEPYLNLLFVLCVKPIEPNSPDAKRRKFFGIDSVPEIDANQYSSEQKLQTFNDFIRNSQQIVTTEEIEQLRNDLMRMKHFGDYFAGKFGFEKHSQFDEMSNESEIDEIETGELESVESVTLSEPTTVHGSEFGEHEIEDPRFVNPGTLSPRIANKGIVYPGIVDPRFVNSKILDPRFVDPRIEDLVDSRIVEPVAIESVNMKPETVKIVEPTLAPEPEFYVVEQQIVNSGITVIPEIVKIEVLEPEIAGSTFIEPDTVESDTANPTFVVTDTLKSVTMEPKFEEQEIVESRIVKPIQNFNEPEISQVILRKPKSPKFSLSTYENRQKAENQIPNDQNATKTPPLPSPRKSLIINDIFEQSTVPQVESQPEPELPKEEIEEAAKIFQKTFSTRKQFFENWSFNEKHTNNTIERPKKNINIQQTEKFVSLGNVLNVKYSPLGNERFSKENVEQNKPNENSIKKAVETKPIAPSSLPNQHHSNTFVHVRPPLNVTNFDIQNTTNINQPQNVVKNIPIKSNDFDSNNNLNQLKSPLMSPISPAFNNHQEYYQTFEPENYYDSVNHIPKEIIIPIQYDFTDNEPRKTSKFQNQKPENIETQVELRKNLHKNQNQIRTFETIFPNQGIRPKTEIITDSNLNGHFETTHQGPFQVNQQDPYFNSQFYGQSNLQNNFNLIHSQRPTSLFNPKLSAQIDSQNFANNPEFYPNYGINQQIPSNSMQNLNDSFSHRNELPKVGQTQSVDVAKMVQQMRNRNQQVTSPSENQYSIPDMINSSQALKPPPYEACLPTNEAIIKSPIQQREPPKMDSSINKYSKTKQNDKSPNPGLKIVIAKNPDQSHRLIQQQQQYDKLQNQQQPDPSPPVNRQPIQQEPNQQEPSQQEPSQQTQHFEPPTEQQEVLNYRPAPKPPKAKQTGQIQNQKLQPQQNQLKQHQPSKLPPTNISKNGKQPIPNRNVIQNQHPVRVRKRNWLDKLLCVRPVRPEYN